MSIKSVIYIRSYIGHWLNQAIINGGRNAPFQLYINKNMLIMSCYQVPFCEHSHFFLKIAKFVMVNEVKGIPVEMAQFSSCLPNACTVGNICTSTWVYSMSLLDQCLGTI